MSVNLVNVEFSDRKDKAATVLTFGLRQDYSEFLEGIKDYPKDIVSHGNSFLVLKIKLAAGADLSFNTEFTDLFATMHSLLSEKGLAPEGAENNPFRQVLTKDHLIISVNTSKLEAFEFPNLILQSFLSFSNRNSLEGDLRVQSMIPLLSVVENVEAFHPGHESTP